MSTPPTRTSPFLGWSHSSENKFSKIPSRKLVIPDLVLEPRKSLGVFMDGMQHTPISIDVDPNVFIQIAQKIM